MTESKPLPDDLRAWVGGHLPGVEQTTDVSWPRSNSRVWRLAAGPTAAFVKLSPTETSYHREILGYAFAARALADHEAPKLLATNPELKAIMSSPLPGQVVRDLPLTAEAERRLHELAGRLLRRWHDRSTPGTEQDRQAVRASVQHQAREAASCLDSTTGRLTRGQRSLVAAAARELPELSEQLPLVYQHGDYSTRNWLWDSDSGHHGLIDFAMVHHGVAVEEFVWLCGAVWATRPDLKAAYLSGYGRPLSDVEDQLLRLLTTRLGVSYLTTGLAQQRSDLVVRGHLILDRMTHKTP